MHFLTLSWGYKCLCSLGNLFSPRSFTSAQQLPTLVGGHLHVSCELLPTALDFAAYTWFYIEFLFFLSFLFLHFSFRNENPFYTGQMFLHLEEGKSFHIINTESQLKVTVKSFYVSLNVRLLINFPHWAPFRSWDVKMHGPGVIS